MVPGVRSFAASYSSGRLRPPGRDSLLVYRRSGSGRRRPGGPGSSLSGSGGRTAGLAGSPGIRGKAGQVELGGASGDRPTVCRPARQDSTTCRVAPTPRKRLPQPALTGGPAGSYVPQLIVDGSWPGSATGIKPAGTRARPDWGLGRLLHPAPSRHIPTPARGTPATSARTTSTGVRRYPSEFSATHQKCICIHSNTCYTQGSSKHAGPARLRGAAGTVFHRTNDRRRPAKGRPPGSRPAHCPQRGRAASSRGEVKSRQWEMPLWPRRGTRTRGRRCRRSCPG